MAKEENPWDDKAGARDIDYDVAPPSPPCIPSYRYFARGTVRTGAPLSGDERK